MTAKSILLLLLFFCFCTASLQAQTDNKNKLIAEDISPLTELKPALANEVYYEPKRRAASPDADFEKLDIKKEVFTPTVNYQPKEIDRSYAVNNPFDMEDLSNPFNLPRPGSRNRLKVKKQDSEDFKKFFNTLFEYKAAPKKTVVNKKPELVAPSWMLFSLLALLSFFAYQTVVYKAENKKALQAYASSTAALQQHRDQRTAITPYSLLSDSLFALVSGHFVFIASNLWLHSNDLDTNWSFANLLFSIAAVSGVYLLKNMQLKALGLIFPFRQQLDYYNYIITNGNRVLALVITPLLFFMVYSPESFKYFSFYLVLTMLSANFVYRYFRTALTSSDLILQNKFHFFIYLCGVELAPVLILLKLLSVI